MNRKAFQDDEEVIQDRFRDWSKIAQSLESETEKKMTKKNTAKSKQNADRAEPNLDSRYGEIGISAVAAALRYQSEVKNPAYAPAVHQPLDKWIAAMAA
jgi:hypothetical protein